MKNEAAWLEAFRIWAERLALGPARREIDDALDLCIESLGARAAAFVRGHRVEFERGYATEGQASVGRGPALALADALGESVDSLDIADTRRWPFADRTHGIELHASGFTRARAFPVLSSEGRVGAVVLWLDETATPAPHADDSIRIVVALLGTGLDRDERPLSAESTLASLGEMTKMAALGHQVESSLAALMPPAAALPLQADELLRVHAELTMLIDPEDRPVVHLLDQLEHAAREMATSASLVRRGLARLSPSSDHHEPREVFEGSRLLEEAVSTARPELERRGFTVRSTIQHDGRLEGDRQEILQAVLALLFSVARHPGVLDAGPPLELRLDGDDEQLTITATVRGARSGPIDLFGPPVPDQCVRIAQAHGGEIRRLPTGLSLQLPTAEASEGRGPITARQPRRVLLVDDDPMFARALSRALRPHEVRLCQTAAEAEIALMDKNFEPDLVVCDLFLPGSNGRSLHERVARSHPNVAPRFVFVSGAPVSSIDSDYFEAAGCRNWTKPVPIDELLDLLA